MSQTDIDEMNLEELKSFFKIWFLECAVKVDELNQRLVNREIIVKKLKLLEERAEGLRLKIERQLAEKEKEE